MTSQEHLKEPYLARQEEDAAIARTLDRILEARGKFADQMAEEAKAMEKIAGKAVEIAHAEVFFLGLSQEEKDNLFGTEKARLEFDNCMKKAKECEEKALRAAKAFRALGVRFRRTTVNLGVIGRQGSGKSLFLQTLSGLSNDYIPSGDGPSCTGVTCVIENVPELEEPQIYFNLKDEETLCREFNQEISQLWKAITGDAEGSPQLAVGALLLEKPDSVFAEIGQELSGQGIERGLLYDRFISLKSIYCEQWDKWRPLLYPKRPERGTEEGRKRSDMEWQTVLEHWKGQMEDWREGLKAYPLELLEESQWATEGVPRCRLRELNLVKDYIVKWHVAKTDSSEIYHYNCYHVAIREAVIRIAFDGVDARVSLIDTVGIGDSSADTRDRMNRAIDADSDGLIFIHRYPNRREFAAFDEVNELKRICSERLSQRPGDWTAFLVNVCPKPDCSSEWIQNYFEPGIRAQMLRVDDSVLTSGAALEQYVKELSDYGITEGLFGSGDADISGQYITMRWAADGADAGTIKTFLNQFLRQISRSLEHVDTGRRADADVLRIEAECAEKELARQLRALYIPSGDHLDMISKRMGERRKKLREELSGHYRKIQRKELKSPLAIYAEEIGSMLEDGQKNDSCLWDIATGAWEDTLPDKRRAKLLALERLYLQIRRLALETAPEHRREEVQFKRELAESFVKTLGIDLSKIGDAMPVSVSDESFFERMKGLLFQEIADAGDLPEYFASLHKFHLNESAVMANAILYHMASEHLCTYTVSKLQEEQDEDRSAQQDQADSPGKNDRYRNMHPLYGGRTYDGQTQTRTMGDHQDVTDENVNEIRELLHRRLQDLNTQLTGYLQAEESYSVAPQDRLREELMNFIMCFGEPYQEVWLRVFNKLYEKGSILQGEMSEFQRMRNIGDQIRRCVNAYIDRVHPD